MGQNHIEFPKARLESENFEWSWPPINMRSLVEGGSVLASRKSIARAINSRVGNFCRLPASISSRIDDLWYPPLLRVVPATLLPKVSNCKKQYFQGH